MRVNELLEEKLTLSFEVFPPREEESMDPLLETLDHLYKFDPAYVSCTYGASGKNVGRNLEVCKAIASAPNDVIAVSHFTCIGNTREKVAAQMDTYLANGVNHILALRGDIPQGQTGTGGDFHYATDLVKFIRQQYGDKFTIAVAGNPEGHIECRSIEADIAHLRQKQDEGADFIMTQLTYDMENFERWLDAIRGAGIWLPVDVGVMPVLNKDSVIRMCLSMNGCVIPRKLSRLISKYFNDPEGFKAAGKEFTVDQIMEYATLGVDGVHLYALNQWKEVTDILTETNLFALRD